MAKIEFKGLGDVAREADDAAARALARKNGTPPAGYLREACCDCGVFGPWGDGKYFYCAEHVPDDLRNAGASFSQLQG